MREYGAEFSVGRMAKVLGVSRSGYYAWDGRPLSRCAEDKVRFDVEVRSVFRAYRGRYGSVKVTRALRRRGVRCNRKRVARVMREQGLRSKARRKYRVTTDSRHSYPVAPNLLNRVFATSGPNRVWVSDITYVPSRAGWLYLAVFIDLFSRQVVGWHISRSLGHETVLAALAQAIGRRMPPRGLMIHSDRGIQYCCEGFRAEIRKHAFVQSMSRKGDCWDNAVAESFFRTLKTELIYHVKLLNEDHARQVLFEYIESFYNSQRLHASLGYVPPAEYETSMLEKCA